MNVPVATGSGFGRFAKKSDDYVAEMASTMQRMGRKLTAQEKQEKLAATQQQQQQEQERQQE